MFEILGEVERLVSGLYPYRVPVTIGGLGAALIVGWYAWRAGWVGRTINLVQRRPLLSAVSAALLVAVMLPAGWYLASPLWTRTTLVEESPLMLATAPPAASTAPPSGSTPAPQAEASPSTPREAYRGTWQGADEFHFASGTAQIIEVEPGRFILRVEEFSIRNGPDLFVYLSPSPEGYEDGALKLGALRATDGSFNYDIPPGTDPSAFRSVVVWCDRFAVLFATATLGMP